MLNSSKMASNYTNNIPSILDDFNTSSSQNDLNQNLTEGISSKSKENFLREFLICAEKFGRIQFTISPLQIFIFEFCISLSIICLILHLMVYSFVPRLRNTPGKCLMSLSVAKICANLCFCSSQYVYKHHIEYICPVVGILRHYFILTVFLWSNIIAFDVYSTFKTSKSFVSLGKNANHLFVRYSLFCWTTPAVFIGFLIIVDLTVDESIFKPNYGVYVCSISRCEAMIMYGLGPISIILMVNVIYFVLILHKLYSTSNETEIANRASLRAQCVWYTKLALILSLAWILSLIAIFTPISHIFFYTHTFSSLQGVIIFIAFTCRRNVYQLMLRRMHYLQDRRKRRSRKKTTMSSYSRTQSHYESETQFNLTIK